MAATQRNKRTLHRSSNRSLHHNHRRPKNLEVTGLVGALLAAPQLATMSTTSDVRRNLSPRTPRRGGKSSCRLRFTSAFPPYSLCKIFLTPPHATAASPPPPAPAL